MRWVEHVAHIGEMKNPCNILVRKREERRHLGDLDADGRIIFKFVLVK
jgi:hypothetical protein